MWNSVKGRKRCIILVMGYYEWLKKSPKEKIPHFTKNANWKIMLLAGLLDGVQYEGTSQLYQLMTGIDERIYMYATIAMIAAKVCLSFIITCQS
jgi:putative SOS response-associated peptidase YedK